MNGGHPPGWAYPSRAERSLGAEGRPRALRRRDSKYTRGRGSAPSGLRSSARGLLCHLPHPSWPLSWHLFWPLGSPTPAQPWGGLLDTREGGAQAWGVPWSPPNPHPSLPRPSSLIPCWAWGCGKWGGNPAPGAPAVQPGTPLPSALRAPILQPSCGRQTGQRLQGTCPGLGHLQRQREVARLRVPGEPRCGRLSVRLSRCRQAPGLSGSHLSRHGARCPAPGFGGFVQPVAGFDRLRRNLRYQSWEPSAPRPAAAARGEPGATAPLGL